MASEKLENVNQSKHFTIMEVGLLKYELVLNESSFADITFDQFKGYNIKLIHQKAFGKSSQTIKDLEIWGKEVNHSPPEYHVWKMLGSLVNVMQIRIALNITEIPSYAFGKPSNLRKLTIRVSNNFTIRNKAFYHLDHLTHLTLNFHFYAHTGYYERPEIQFQGLEFRESQLGDSQNRKLPQELPYLIKIQNGAFAFEKPSNKKLNIMFIRFKFQGESFEPGSFDGIQRPVELKLQDSSITYLPETMLKSFLNNENNTISFDNSRVNCSDCRNSWLFKENLHENQYDQLKNAECMRESVSNLLDENNKLTLFSFETELYFKSNCNLKFTSKNKSEINYYPCQYHSEKVRFKLKIYNLLIVYVIIYIVGHFALSIKHDQFSTIGFQINQLSIESN